MSEGAIRRDILLALETNVITAQHDAMLTAKALARPTTEVHHSYLCHAMQPKLIHSADLNGQII